MSTTVKTHFPEKVSLFLLWQAYVILKMACGTQHTTGWESDADQRLKIYSNEVLIIESYCKYHTKYDMTTCCKI